MLHKITKPTAWRGGVQILKEEEEDSKHLASCEEKMKEWAEHWQCDTNVQDPNDEPWRNEELKKLVCRGYWKKGVGEVVDGCKARTRVNAMAFIAKLRWS